MDRSVRLPGLDDRDASMYTVGQAGDLLSVPAATLRRLESSGAVSPTRSPGGQRRYSRSQLEHAGRLLDLVNEGLTLAGALRVAMLEDQVRDLRSQLECRRPARSPAPPPPQA